MRVPSPSSVMGVTARLGRPPLSIGIAFQGAAFRVVSAVVHSSTRPSGRVLFATDEQPQGGLVGSVPSLKTSAVLELKANGLVDYSNDEMS